MTKDQGVDIEKCANVIKEHWFCKFILEFIKTSRKERGRLYYYREDTDETTWEKPVEYDGADGSVFIRMGDGLSQNSSCMRVCFSHT